MKHGTRHAAGRRLRLLAVLAAGMPLWAAAATLRGADEGFVSVRGDRLACGETTVVFSCALGVRLPWPDPAEAADDAAASSRWERARADCGNLARRYAAAGFNMVLLPDLEPETSEEASPRKALQDEFLLACRRAGVRVWAEPLHSFLATPIPPGAAELAGDPATRDEWLAAVEQAGPAAHLAAAWDPRIAAWEQRLLRDWSRAFNPGTGLRRCDDPAFALFGFSSYWLADMLDPDRVPLPDFFENELREAWNAWLLEQYDSDEAFAIWHGPFAPGESIESNSVPFRAFSDPALSDDLREEQKKFLIALRNRRFGELLDAFRTYGRAAREAPRLVTDDHEQAISAFSSITPLPAESGKGSRPRAITPLLVDAFGADSPEEAHEAARRAVAAGAQILALPCRDRPEDFAEAAQLFRAGQDVPDDLAKIRPGTVNLPRLGVGSAVLASDEDEMPVLRFPATDAGVTVLRVRPGRKPKPSPVLDPFSVRLQLCVPTARRTKSEPNADETVAETAPEEGEAEAGGGDEESAGPDEEPEEPALRVTASVWRPEGSELIVVRLSLQNAETGEDVRFSLNAYGPALARKQCLPMDANGAEWPSMMPTDGAFRFRRHTPPLLRFEPAPLGALLPAGL